MELDSRILEDKKPLTCFDIEEAKKYVGKDCYFSSKFENFENLSKVPHATLHNVDDSHTPFQCYGKDGVLCYDCFILPCEWVKPEEPEKKYRAFTLTEWINQYEIGRIIHYRSKSDGIEANIMYMGTYHHKNKGTIVLGVASYTLDCLFEEYEIEIDGEWQPFGVLIEENE